MGTVQGGVHLDVRLMRRGWLGARREDVRWLGALLLLASTLSCESGDGGGDASPGDQPSGAGVTRQCGGGCQTDLGAARASLEAGDFAGAYELYQCADSPEAAFGAGFSRILSALESDSGKAVLADLGYGPMSAADLLGPDSLASRWNARWSGSAQLAITGDVDLSANLRVEQEIHEDDGEYLDVDLEGVDMESEARVELQIYYGGRDRSQLPSAGSLFESSFDCQSGLRRASGSSPSVSLGFTHEGVRYYCSAARAQAPDNCNPDGGSITVVQPGHTVGTPAEYRLEDLLVACELDGYSVNVGRVAAPALTLRVSGNAQTTTVSSRLDTTGLHPIFGASDVLGRIPPDVTVSQGISHLAGVTDQWALASCYFDRASAGTGTVFQLPGILYGGDDVSFAPGDAKVLAGLSALFAAAGHMAAAYSVDMPLGALLCEESCPAGDEVTTMFNQVFAQVFHADRFAAAKPFLEVGIARLSAGIDALDGDSLFLRDSTTEPGLVELRELLDASATSLQSGQVSLPNFEPALRVDLRALFDRPPSRTGIGSLPLSHTSDCDGTGTCYEDTELNEAFFRDFLGGVVEWDEDVEWRAADAVDDSLEEMARSFQRKGVLVTD